MPPLARFALRVLLPAVLPAALLVTGCASGNTGDDDVVAPVRAPAERDAEEAPAKPADPARNTCSTNELAGLPAQTGYSAACGASIRSVLTTPKTNRTSNTVPLSDRCSLSGLALQGLELYHAYWDDRMGWEDFASGSGNGAQDHEINVEVTEHGKAGWTVMAGDGGDESSLGMVFDPAGKLLGFYQYNQSPEVGFFCGEGKPGNEPESDCLGDAISSNASTNLSCLE